jgi:tetratricopeptide (TPR) repeat protein
MRNFERALELADSSEQKAKILANIGNLYFSAEKPQVALGFYREAAAEYDKNPLYLVLIARTFLVLNENDRARKALAQAEAMERLLDKDEREEDRGLGSYLMALSYAALNDEEKVLKYVNRVLKINPKKYLPRIKKELSDETSLLYTLQDHPKIAQMMRSFSIEDFLGTGLKR